MLATYFRAMDALHAACVFLAGVSIAVITLIIPWGVFTRYVLNSASSWPEPLAILMMIWLSFLSAIVCYREHRHIGVNLIPDLLTGRAKALLGLAVEACMLATSVFLLWYGIKLIQTTWYQSIAEFPIVSVGVSYLPVPIGGAITALLVIERVLKGDFFPAIDTEEDPHETISTE
jgi:TRAP-type C4-dicarboxylate transport system permease small subunit